MQLWIILAIIFAIVLIVMILVIVGKWNSQLCRCLNITVVVCTYIVHVRDDHNNDNTL